MPFQTVISFQFAKSETVDELSAGYPWTIPFLILIGALYKAADAGEINAVAKAKLFMSMDESMLEDIASCNNGTIQYKYSSCEAERQNGEAPITMTWNDYAYRARVAGAK